MKAYKYIIVLFFLIITSCANRNDGKMVTVDLTTLSDDTLYYSSFVDSLSYLTLETKDECLIGEVTDLILTDQYILVFDKRQQTIWIFNSKGEYSHSICHKGNGPGEYANLTQFEFDTLNNELLLLDGWSGTILRYSFDGKYIDGIKLNIYPSDFKKTSEGYLLSLLGAPDSIGGVYHYDLHTNQCEQLIKRSTNLSCNFSWEIVSFDDTIAFMAPPFENVVYHSYAGKTEEFLPLQMLPLPSQEYDYFSSKQHLPDFIRTDYIEGTNWIYATYWCATHDLRVFLYSKKDQSYSVARKLVNDIDGRKCDYMTSACNNNQFVFGCLNDNGNPRLQILHLK